MSDRGRSDILDTQAMANELACGLIDPPKNAEQTLARVKQYLEADVALPSLERDRLKVALALAAIYCWEQR